MSQKLAEEEPEKYQPHFSEFIQKGIEAEDMEALYKKVHAAIGADPSISQPSSHQRSTTGIVATLLTFYIYTLYMVTIILSFALPLPSVCFQVQPQEADICAEEGQPR